MAATDTTYEQALLGFDDIAQIRRENRENRANEAQLWADRLEQALQMAPLYTHDDGGVCEAAH